jgi:plastocyanin
MRATLRIAACVVAVAGLMSGCGSSDNAAPPPSSAVAVPTTSTTSAPAPDIVISNFSFAVRGPVKAGQQVNVVNDDQANHSLASDDNGAFDVRVSGGGGETAFTAPMVPGTYPFHCKYHANMHGSLIVQ